MTPSDVSEYQCDDLILDECPYNEGNIIRTDPTDNLETCMHMCDIVNHEHCKSFFMTKNMGIVCFTILQFNHFLKIALPLDLERIPLQIA